MLMFGPASPSYKRQFKLSLRYISGFWCQQTAQYPALIEKVCVLDTAVKI